MSESKGPSKILGYLYLGGKQDAKAKSLLQQLKIKYILNVTPPRSVDPESGCPSFFEKEKSFVYSRIPVFDNRGEDLLQYMDQSFRFIEEGKHYGGVLVHCHKGVSRSSTFVIGYLMKNNEMSLDEALDFVKSIRPIIMPNLAFMAQLEAYEILLDKERGPKIKTSESPSHNCPSSGTIVCDIGPSIGPSLGPKIDVDVSALGENVLPVQPAVTANISSRLVKDGSASSEELLLLQNDLVFPVRPHLPVEGSIAPLSSDEDGLSTSGSYELLEPSSKKIKPNPA